MPYPKYFVGLALWLYHRFNQARCDFEDLPAGPGIIVGHEAIRRWCNELGAI